MYILEKKKDLISIPIFYLKTLEKGKNLSAKQVEKKEIIRAESMKLKIAKQYYLQNFYHIIHCVQG